MNDRTPSAVTSRHWHNPPGAVDDTATRVLAAVINAHVAGTSTGAPSLALAIAIPRATVASALDRLDAAGLITRDPGVDGSTRPAAVIVAADPPGTW